MKPAFEVKSTRIHALTVQLYTSDVAELSQLLDERAGRYRELRLPLVLDVQPFMLPEELDLAAVLAVFREHGLSICALRHTDSVWAEAAQAHQLAFDNDSGSPTADLESAESSADDDMPETAAPAEPVQATIISRPTVFVSAPIRTGQQVYAEGADLIVTGVVSEGAEIIADGNIHVYAPMRGRALAGAGGRRDARIFIHNMQAELVSVAGIYRNFEQELPAHLNRHAVQVYLQDDRLVVSAIDTK